MVPFRLILTKDQSLTPEQQDLDRANVRHDSEEPSHMGTSAGCTGTPAHHAEMSAGRLGTSGCTGTSASRTGTPSQFGGESGNCTCKKEAEQAASQEHKVCQFNVYQLPVTTC